MSAIVVDNISKRYLIGHQVRHDTLRDSLAHGARAFLSSLKRGPRLSQEEFWALRDVSFKVEAGEVVGIIGRNGAGKSTLLKILSRITEPTHGRITLRGRVASLLEVGTGFHPELSGRENIFLNGAILGMSRAEIRKKFDEIVAFAEVERFLDTPVKRYSSGMYVRLAFAVAAHLEPEILIVDEVLAVGDAGFQKKCLGKMSEVAGSGRTVLFVSHNISVVRNLCRSAVLLKEGRVLRQGDVHEVTADYLAMAKGANEDSAQWTRPAESSSAPHLAHIQIQPGAAIRRGEVLHIRITLGGSLPEHPVVTIVLQDEDERVILHSSDEFNPQLPRSTVREMLLDTRVLNVGRHHVTVSLAVRNVAVLDRQSGGLCFTVEDPELAVAGTDASNWKGAISPRLPVWQ
jgi:lipopolysaccharide transport system ATP-binding protein